jgi:hypothetical protein
MLQVILDDSMKTHMYLRSDQRSTGFNYNTVYARFDEQMHVVRLSTNDGRGIELFNLTVSKSKRRSEREIIEQL